MANGRRGHGEGSITRRSDGRWQAIIDLGYAGGKRQRKSIYGRTRADVARALTAALRDQQQGLPIVGEKETIAQFFNRWLQDVAAHTVRQSTFDGYAGILRNHVLPELGRHKLARLAAQDLAHLYSALLEKGLSPRTVQLAHAVIHRGLRQALRWNLVAVNVADAVDAPRPARKETQLLSPEESVRFLAAAKETPDYALYTLALTTGMRLGELAGLQWADCDLEGGVIHIRRQITRTSKGWSATEPKTAKGRRTVALPSFAVAALRGHRAAQAALRLQTGPVWEDQGLVFPNGLGRPLERQNVAQRSFKPLLAKAGLPDIRFHDLRHSAATLLLSLGEHPKVVQERLGHATIAITMDIYSHVMPQMQRQAAEKLNVHFGALS